MNPAIKFILRDKLKEKLPTLTDDVAYNVLLELDKLGALSEEWDGVSKTEKEIKTKETKSSLPDSFNMVSPLWSGYVSLITREGFFCYQDNDGNVRLHGKSERELSKKIIKYRK